MKNASATRVMSVGGEFPPIVAEKRMKDEIGARASLRARDFGPIENLQSSIFPRG
jgi:hypothetical protein